MTTLQTKLARYLPPLHFHAAAADWSETPERDRLAPPFSNSGDLPHDPHEHARPRVCGRPVAYHSHAHSLTGENRSSWALVQWEWECLNRARMGILILSIVASLTRAEGQPFLIFLETFWE